MALIKSWENGAWIQNLINTLPGTAHDIVFQYYFSKRVLIFQRLQVSSDTRHRNTFMKPTKDTLKLTPKKRFKDYPFNSQTQSYNNPKILRKLTKLPLKNCPVYKVLVHPLHIKQYAINHFKFL